MIHRIFPKPLSSDQKKILAATTVEQRVARNYRGPMDLALSAGPLEVEYPISANIEVTNKCQLACSHCGRSVNNFFPRQMTKTEFELVCRELAQTGVSLAALHYLGEPLMHNEIIDLLHEAQTHFKEVTLTTNGILLTGTLAEQLLKTPPDRINISLDGFDEESYNQNRCGGDLGLIEENLRNFRAARDRTGQLRPLIAVETLLIPGALPRLAQLRAWAHLADLLEVRPCYPPVADQQLFSAEPDIVPCKFAFRHVVVRADGQVEPCCLDFAGDLALGNIYTSSFKELWTGAFAWHLRRTLLSPTQLPVCCRHCPAMFSAWQEQIQNLLTQTDIVS